VKSVYDSLALPAIGPGLRAFPTTDPDIPQIPFDPAASKRELDSLGWRDSGGTGVRARRGRQLAFRIVVPSSSKARGRMAVLIQEQLRQVGVTVEIEQVPIPTFVDRSDKRSFDALVVGLHSDPSPSAARGDWTTTGIATGNNRGSYSNPAFDAAIDSALAAYEVPVRRALFSRAYRIIIGDAPAIWLAEPKVALGVHRRIHVTGLRADAWWKRLADWWIAPDERIQRDLLSAAPVALPVADTSRIAH
jgi:peptide/nickel transport system substrate-binding protein